MEGAQACKPEQGSRQTAAAMTPSMEFSQPGASLPCTTCNSTALLREAAVQLALAPT